MSLIQTQIEGTSALLQHAFSIDFEDPSASRVVLARNASPREQAEAHLYRDGEVFYVPGSAISRLLREAGASHKLKGSRQRVKFLVPAAVVVTEDALPLLDPSSGLPLATWEVDSRPVVILATKGRIMRHRPRFEKWGLAIQLEIDEEVLPEDLVHVLLAEGGRRIGIGNFRPEKGGPFGRFRVVQWRRIP